MTLDKQQHTNRLFPGAEYSSSLAVVFWLFLSLLSFYTVFYITASLVHGIFQLSNFDGTIPFHYKSFENIFTNSTVWSTQPFLGDFIALECTYFFSAFVFLTFLRQRLWDFSITVTVVHSAITCAVNISFPLVWEWWICILVGLFINISFGQLINQIINMKKKGSMDLNKT
ncbi:transmembrane protein 244-like [Acanthaster planci]|uniref:Transmembrane protein 244-like n=1 Tax=Acanthaster planci TaxID=133434 RepID=A0A8B7ZH69_ACAPL|nr:transmembrane protein 244-like [Acanthaster planci]